MDGQRLIRGDVLRASIFLVPLLGVCLLASADARAGAPAAGADATLFDSLIDQAERGELVLNGPQQVRAFLARLEGLLPPEDPLRELRLRGVHCDFDDLDSPGAGLAYARQGLADAQRLGDVASQIRFHLCEANYTDGAGQVGQSAAPVEAALALAREFGDPRLLAHALGRRGNVYSLLGQQAAALSDFLEVQTLLRGAGLLLEAEANLHEVAIAFRRMGDHDKAREYLAQSIAFAEREQRWGLLSVSLLQTAFAHQDSGNPDKALALHRHAAEVAAAHALDYEFAAAQLGIAAAQVKLGGLEDATAALAVARRGFERFGDRSNDGMLHLLEGQVRAGRGDHTGAQAHYRAAGRAFAADPNPRYEVELHAARARSHEARGEYREALEDTQRELDGRQQGYEDARLQHSLLLQYQFDTARRELEHARLQAERSSQQQRLQDIERANRWQLGALVSGGMLLALLLFLLRLQLQRMRRISALALTDPLTGVANRRHLEAAAIPAVAKARRRGRPLAAVTFDLDGFKQINDGHGHAHGDQVLVRVVRACESVLRPGDLLGRIGGEEFLVLFPDTPLEAAAALAERLRASVERIDLADIAEDLRVTISLGLSPLKAQDTGLPDMVARADAALYRAKANGRNRVELQV